MVRLSMTRLAFVGGALILVGAAVAAERAGADRRPQTMRLGVTTYTFNRFTFLEAVQKTKELGLKDVEVFAWQSISPEHKDVKLDQKASPELLKDVRKKLDEAGVRLSHCYVADFGKDEAETRTLFTFAKTMRIRTLVGEPKSELLPLLDKLSQEYGVNVAVHNHPKSSKGDSYVNWDPDQVMKMIQPYGKRIGCCADTGHWVRSGLDPVACLKKYEGRVLSLHMKDVSEKGPAGHDVPYGTGVGNIKAQLQELKRQKFRGLIGIEYEHNMDNNLPDLRQCIEFYNKTIKELGD